MSTNGGEEVKGVRKKDKNADQHREIKKRKMHGNERLGKGRCMEMSDKKKKKKKKKKTTCLFLSFTFLFLSHPCLPM